MKYLLLLLLSVVACAGTKEEHERSLEEARSYVYALYMSQAVEDFCSVRPEAVYRTTWNGMPIEVPCDIRNAWVALQKKNEG
jgi:hypothetical protein